MNYINKFETTEEFNQAIEGGGQLSDLEHFIAYDVQADKIHVKPKPNYFIFYQKVRYGISTIFTRKENGYDDKEISLGRSETVKIDGANAIYGFRSGNVLVDVIGFDGSNYDTSKIKHMGSMFTYAYFLKNVNFSNFNTKNVISMNSMFYDCNSLVEMDLSSFDTSQVTDMNSMFYDCSGLTSLDLSSFDTSQVTDMSSMFYNCNSLETLNLSNFNTSDETNMISMFNKCSKLSKIICKQAFKDWCIKYKNNVGLPKTMVNGTVGAVGSGSNWEIVDYQP